MYVPTTLWRCNTLSKSVITCEEWITLERVGLGYATGTKFFPFKAKNCSCNCEYVPNTLLLFVYIYEWIPFKQACNDVIPRKCETGYIKANYPSLKVFAVFNRLDDQSNGGYLMIALDLYLEWNIWHGMLHLYLLTPVQASLSESMKICLTHQLTGSVLEMLSGV